MSDAKFCVNCGAPVAGQPVPGPPAAGQPVHDQPALDQPVEGEQTAERRQLTVLFSDLVGSTAISELLDPEDLALRHPPRADCNRYDSLRGLHAAA